MKFRALACALEGGVLGAGRKRGPLGSHHSFGVEYDANKPISAHRDHNEHRVDQSHCFIYIDVKDKDGKVTNWKMEGFPPSVLYRSGWRRDETVKVG